MELILSKFLLLGLIFWVQIHTNKGCFEEERLALLEFKASVVSLGWDADHMLPSWVGDLEANCCEWERVTCNSSTSHVIELSLGSTWQSENIWFLNISLFQNFEELRSLNLSSNTIGGWIDNEGTESLSRLKVIETLDLSGNKFNKSIIQSLSALKSLKNLILSRNQLTGSFSAQEFSTLENLEMLDLSFNELNSSTLMPDLKSVSNLSKLKHADLSFNHFNNDILRFLGVLPSLRTLDLSFNRLQGLLSGNDLDNLNNLAVLKLQLNNLNGTLPMQNFAHFRSLKILDLSLNSFSRSIPPSTWEPSSLRELYLYGNKFNGSLPIQSFCGLKTLQKLDLSYNNFEGSLPPCLGNLTSLRLLDLSVNRFTGNIPSSLLASLKSLEYVDLSQNHFEGLFSFKLFANHSNLKVVQIRSDNKIKVETKYTGWVPSFQLKVLVLSNCGLNSVPGFLFHQFRLREVDLSHNKIKGRFPNWVLENNTGLEYLSFRNNCFNGQFHLPVYSGFIISWMDVSNNFLTGQLQNILGMILPNLTYLNLSRNAFEGELPSSIGNASKLQSLDVAFNNFTGEVPEKLVSSCIALIILNLSYNNFFGQLFSSTFNMTQIWVLQLSDNHFTGTLSSLVTTLPELRILDTSNNYFHGPIPSWVGNLTEFFTLITRNNSFTGPISCGLLSYQYVDLSHNSLSDSLPSCFNLQKSKHIHLQGNKFTGPIPHAFLNSSTLLTLDIRENSLSGRIPTTLGAVSNLRVLLLGGNHLTGLIPNELCQLNEISLMDLSGNYLSGSIPHCLYNMSFGRRLTDDRVFKNSKFLIGADKLSTTYGSLLDKFPSDRIEKYLDKEIDFIAKDGRYGRLFLKFFGIVDPGYTIEEKVEFLLKDMPRTYKGDVLNFMSGLDLSRNNLTGEIPDELGKLSGIRALNLSHNHLAGLIQKSFSNLTQLESLDLSYNALSGEFPSELTDLNFLAVFTVAHNNLSGRIPDKKQFGTFDNSSYEGNPFLCGAPLEKKCANANESSHLPTASSNESEGKWYEVDPWVFFSSFAASYFVVLLGIATVLYINPYWRRRWFDFVEDCMYSCYYFVCDTLRKLSAKLHN